MAAENFQIIHLKLQMQPDIEFFEKLLMNNRAFKISEFSHHFKKSSSTSPRIAKSRMSKQEDSPCLNYLTQEDAHWLGKGKSNLNKGELGNRDVFWWGKV